MIVRIQLWELAALRIRKTHDQSPIEGMLQTLVAVFTEGERIEEIQCCDKIFLKLYKRLLPISSQHALWVNSVCSGKRLLKLSTYKLSELSN